VPSPKKREARNELLEAEIELRERIPELAALRRGLPPGRAAPLEPLRNFAQTLSIIEYLERSRPADVVSTVGAVRKPSQ